MRGVLTLPALALGLACASPVLADEQADAEAAALAYHNAQQAYLSGLMASDGWYTMEGGLRVRNRPSMTR